MTDDIITRNEAIDRMKAGLPCHTIICSGVRDTEWEDFKYSNRTYCIPPEPRRVAREWWISPAPKGKTNYDYAFTAEALASIHVREVLPGDVTLQRMTVEQAAKDWHAWRRDCGWTDDMRHHAVWLASRCALGLIGEGS